MTPESVEVFSTDKIKLHANLNFPNTLQLALPGLWSTGVTKSQLQIRAWNNYIHTYIRWMLA